MSFLVPNLKFMLTAELFEKEQKEPKERLCDLISDIYCEYFDIIKMVMLTGIRVVKNF